MKYFILSVFIAGFLSSCSKDDITEDRNTMYNVRYGADAAQSMDIYLPSTRSTTTTKVIIMIHGGAWSSGDKADFNGYIDSLKKRLPGYAIFNINYRLATATANLFPTQEEDVKAAVEFIYNKREEYGISDKFVLMGASAGGHLALLQAYKYTIPVKIKAVVDFFGPTDMTEMYNHPASIFITPAMIASVVGATPASNPTLYQQSSPVNFINAQTPPTIILHGGADPVVSPNQSSALKSLLDAQGIVNQYVFYPTEIHGWAFPRMSDSFDKIQVFLAANVN